MTRLMCSIKEAPLSVISFVLSISLFGVSVVHAAPLYYTPTNPSFGGNPLNGSVLLNNANAQNDYSDPDDDEDETALGEFNEEGNLVPGVTETTDFTIEIIDLGDGTTSISTTDRLTGDTTTFTVSNN